MEFTVQSGRLAKASLRMTVLAAAIALTACGGGGSSDSVNNAGTTPATPTGPSIPASTNSIYLTTENTAFDTSGGTVKVQARVIDKNGGAVVNESVTFKLTNTALTGVVINQAATVITDETGVAQVELLLPVNTSQTKIDYLVATGVEVVATVGNDTSGYASQSLTMKGQQGGGSAINKTEKYSLAISADQLSLTTGKSATEVTVNVTDKLGGIVANAPVVLSLANPSKTGVTLSVASSQTTDENGQVTFFINQTNSKLDYRLNHAVDLNVLVDDGTYLPATQTLSIPVTGTKLTLTSDSTIISATTGNVTITTSLRDGANTPIASSSLDLLNTDGSVLQTGTTDTAGMVKFTVPANSLIVDSSGQIKLSARAHGSTVGITQDSDTPLTLVTRDGEFVFETLPTSETAINTAATIKVQVKANAESELMGKTIRLSSSLGTLDASVKSVSNVKASGSVFVGDATFSLTSGSPGIANLQATFGSDTIRAQTEFVSPIATKINVQSAPSVVSPKGTSAITVRLTDANDAPVKNKLVQFKLLADSSGGQIVTPEAITDSNGEASVNYVAGNLNTARNGVTIQAVSGTLTTSTYLTVAARAITIAIGNSNKISSSDTNTYYQMNVSANVVDNVGQPITNQLIAIRIIPTTYRKAEFAFDSIRVPPYDSVSGNGVNIMTYENRWYYTKGQSSASDINRNLDANGQPIVIPNVTDDEGFITGDDNIYTRPWECSAEDTNGNGVLDVDLGEDINNNGKLDGMNVVTLLGYTPDSTGVYTLKTDGEGKFDFNVRYLKRYAQWLSIRIEASTNVQGTEAFGSVPINLPVLADDIDDSGKVDRPNGLSPYGVNPCNMDQ